jgi:hypothetical protein
MESRFYSLVVLGRAVGASPESILSILYLSYEPAVVAGEPVVVAGVDPPPFGLRPR